MSNIFRIKQSSTPGHIPLNTDLQVSELSLNLADKIIFSKDVGGNIISLNTPADIGADTSAEVTAKVNAHANLTNNPHSVTKAQVGLANADNTSDANKPVSTAQQTALDGKQATLVSGTNIKTINGSNVLGSGDLVIESDSVVVSGIEPTGSIEGDLWYDTSDISPQAPQSSAAQVVQADLDVHKADPHPSQPQLDKVDLMNSMVMNTDTVRPNIPVVIWNLPTEPVYWIDGDIWISS